MTHVIKDRVRETTITTGAADFDLAGAVNASYQAFGSVMSTGDTCWYAAVLSATEWEVGLGTYNSVTNRIARTTVLASSNGGSAVSFSTGTKDIWIDLPAASFLGQGDLTALLSNAQKKQARDNIGVTPVRGHLSGLTLTTAGSSATFGVAVGVAADSTAASMMTLASAYTKTTSAWAVGTGNGALDTGTIANNTWYHVFLIQRPDTFVVDLLLSLSATAPTLPANYTLFRRIGSMKTNGSAQWFTFSQNGDEFIAGTPTNDINSAVLGTTSTLFSLNVPPGVTVYAKLRGYITNSTTANVAVLVHSPAEGTPPANGVTGNFTAIANAAASFSGFVDNIRTDTSQQIRAVSTAAGTTIATATIGWIDRRGRDA